MIDIDISYNYYIEIAEAVNAGKFEEASEILRKLNQLSEKKKFSKIMRSPHTNHVSQQKHAKAPK